MYDIKNSTHIQTVCISGESIHHEICDRADSMHVLYYTYIRVYSYACLWELICNVFWIGLARPGALFINDNKTARMFQGWCKTPTPFTVCRIKGNTSPPQSAGAFANMDGLIFDFRSAISDTSAELYNLIRRSEWMMAVVLRNARHVSFG